MNPFQSPIQEFQFYDKYSRFNHGLGRRETWEETVDRTLRLLHGLGGDRLESREYERIRSAILHLEVMPSMRLLAMAGPAAERDNTVIYNCAYLTVDSLAAFTEALLISMAGCGVGYSVEREYVQKLPRVIPTERHRGKLTHIVEDSAEGWGRALTEGLNAWFSGYGVDFDYSQIRPAGAVLRTKGGRASGPEPLRKMLEFAKGRILARQGQQLRPIDAHDIMCAIGGGVVSGGVRRTAMLALFDFYGDPEMRFSKDGDFEAENSQRWNANNSAVLPKKMFKESFEQHFSTMVEGGRGEPGIFNRAAMGRPLWVYDGEDARRWRYGTNPCGEIVLRPRQFCNLSMVVAREWDNFYSLAEKVELATLIGTIQSMATFFPNLSDAWKRNCEEERLLGVDITGQMDCPVVREESVQERLRSIAVASNRHYAKALGINASAAITCVKPSGNSSVLLDCSSGLHPRPASYYIRRVRVGAHSPTYRVLRESGVPLSPENGQSAEDATTWVASFPMKAPTGAIVRGQRSALEQLEYWLQVKRSWTHHNPSVTITYQPDEVAGMIDWLWGHLPELGGLSFLPASGAKYDQMPEEEISQEEYERLAAGFPAKIDWSMLSQFESEDMTTVAQEVACSAGGCEWEGPR